MVQSECLKRAPLTRKARERKGKVWPSNQGLDQTRTAGELRERKKPRHKEISVEKKGSSNPPHKKGLFLRKKKGHKKGFPDTHGGDV